MAWARKSPRWGLAPSITVDTGLLDSSYGATTLNFTPTSQTGSQGISASSPSTMSNALGSAQTGNRSSFTGAGTIGTPNLGAMDLTGGGSSAMQSPDSQNQSLSSTNGNRQTFGRYGVGLLRRGGRRHQPG